MGNPAQASNTPPVTAPTLGEDHATVSTPVKAPTKKPLYRKWWFWVSIAAVILLTVGSIAVYLVSNYATMPDLTGEAPYEAGQRLASINEDWEINYVTSDEISITVAEEDDYAGWEVVSSEPVSGEVLKKKDVEQQITLTVQLTEEYKAEREQIIDDYVRGQQINYGWPDNSISTSDYGDLVLIKFFSSRSSHDWNSSDLDGAQVEVDMLATNLKCSILLIGYTSDYYLEHINVGLCSGTPEGAVERTATVAAAIMQDADKYAIENREKWLDDFCAIEEQDLINNGDRTAYAWVDYRILENGVAIVYKQYKNTSFTDYEYAVDYYQYIANRCALFLRSDAAIAILDDYSDETELSVTAAKPNYLYDKYGSS
jgi:hypothetical protein